MLVHILFVFLFVLLYSFVSPEIMLFLLILYCILGISRVLQSKNHIVSPLSLMYINFLIQSVSNINLLALHANAKIVSYSYLIFDNVQEATLLLCISSIVTIIGLEFFINNKLLPIIAINLPKKWLNALFVFLVVISSKFVLGFFINLSFLGAINKIISLAGIFGLLFFIRLWIKEKDKKYLIYAYFLYFVATITALLNSYLRIELISPTIILILSYLIAHDDYKPLLNFNMVPIAVIFLIFISTFGEIGKYRGEQSGLSIIMNSFNSKNEFESKFNSLEYEKGQSSIFERSSNLAQLTQVIKLTKEKGFYNGAVSAPLLGALIPRFLWPDKPPVELGIWFALEAKIAYKSDQNDAHANNSVNMTIPGELFLDFGYIGVILGCFLVGGFLSIIWNALGFYDSVYNLSGSVFGGYLLFIILMGVGADLQIVISLTSLYLVFWLIRRVL